MELSNVFNPNKPSIRLISHIKPLAASSAIERRDSQSNCFCLPESDQQIMLQIYKEMLPSKVANWHVYEGITWRYYIRVYHVYDPVEYHCAYTHRPEFVEILHHRFQWKEPSFYDEFLITELPDIMSFFYVSVCSLFHTNHCK